MSVAPETATVPSFSLGESPHLLSRRLARIFTLFHKVLDVNRSLTAQRVRRRALIAQTRIIDLIKAHFSTVNICAGACRITFFSRNTPHESECLSFFTSVGRMEAHTGRWALLTEWLVYFSLPRGYPSFRMFFPHMEMSLLLPYTFLDGDDLQRPTTRRFMRLSSR
jgi:hypothetical protein